MARTTRILVALVAAVSLIAVAPGAEGQDPDPVAPGENGPVMESDPEVVGGTVAANGEFPWLVALTQRGQPATSQF